MILGWVAYSEAKDGSVILGWVTYSEATAWAAGAAGAAGAAAAADFVRLGYIV